jgi:hypothetical protein
VPAAPRDGDRPLLVVVAVPPDVVADVVERELAAFPDAVVTDVASVKLDPLRELRRRGVDLTHYIGSHPMAGASAAGPSRRAPTSSWAAPGSCAATRRPRHPISHSSKGSRSTSARRPSR